MNSCIGRHCCVQLPRFKCGGLSLARDLRTPPLLRSAGSRQASRGSCSGARVSPERAPPALQRWRPLLKRVLSQLRSSLGHQCSGSNKAALSLLCRHPFLCQRALHTELTESSRRAGKKGAKERDPDSVRFRAARAAVAMEGFT